jgi:hypothetical protein
MAAGHDQRQQPRRDPEVADAVAKIPPDAEKLALAKAMTEPVTR